MRIDPTVWDEEIARFAERSPARVAAERERGGLERDGISMTSLLACEPRAEVVKTIGQTSLKVFIVAGHDRPRGSSGVL